MKPFCPRPGDTPLAGRQRFEQRRILMQTYIYVGLAVAVAGLGLVLYLFRRKSGRPKRELESFNFDKSKSYEKDGRKYPFSY
jgi:hypothetical protein